MLGGGGLGIAPVRRGHRGGGAVANAGIYREAAGNQCGLYCNTTKIQVVYRGGGDDRVQTDPDVMGSRPQPGRVGQRSQLRGGG